MKTKPSSKPASPKLIKVRCSRCERTLCHAPAGARVSCEICHRWHVVITVPDSNELCVREWKPNGERKRRKILPPDHPLEVLRKIQEENLRKSEINDHGYDSTQP